MSFVRVWRAICVTAVSMTAALHQRKIVNSPETKEHRHTNTGGLTKCTTASRLSLAWHRRAALRTASQNAVEQALVGVILPCRPGIQAGADEAQHVAHTVLLI